MAHTHERPPGFVYVDEVVAHLVTDLRYAGADNFTGRPVPGYLGRRAILTKEAACALGAVQQEARGAGLALLIWDAYRPQRAVDAFVAWRDTPCDARLKSMYHPECSKEAIFRDGLIASPSAHSRGSTVDLTLIPAALGDARAPGGQEAEGSLDTGGHFDLFAARSATAYAGISAAQRANRRFLCDLMDRHGFENLPSEWWHYTLRGEPFPKTYFDFEVRDDWSEV